MSQQLVDQNLKSVVGIYDSVETLDSLRFQFDEFKAHAASTHAPVKM